MTTAVSDDKLNALPKELVKANSLSLRNRLVKSNVRKRGRGWDDAAYNGPCGGAGYDPKDYR